MFQIPYSFIYFKAQKNNTVNVFITNNSLLYLVTHLKFSSVFYSSQLNDMFAYELPFIGMSGDKKKPLISGTNNQPSVMVYNFHSMFFHNRVFLFSQHNHNIFENKIQNNYYTLNSIAELFPAAN
jgi:hypothetical protein